MQDYDTGWMLSETEQAEYDAWQEEGDRLAEQERHAAWWAWVHDQERE